MSSDPDHPFHASMSIPVSPVPFWLANRSSRVVILLLTFLLGGIFGLIVEHARLSPSKEPAATERPTAVTVAPTPNPDPVGIRDLLIQGVKGIKIVDSFADPLMIKYNREFQNATGVYVADWEWQIEDYTPIVDSLENGTAEFNGRRIPAAIITAHFKAVNRARGERRLDYVRLTAATDRDFGILRYIRSWTDEEAATQEIDEWKKTVSFQPEKQGI